MYLLWQSLAPSGSGAINLLVAALLLIALPLLTTMAVSVRLRRVGIVDRGHFELIAREHDMMCKLIDSLPDFIYVKDRQGRFLLANTFCCESMGAEQERLLGRTDFDFYPSGLAESYHDDEQAVMASGRALAARQEDVLVNDGRTLTILTTKVPLRDPAGDVVGVMGIGRDITARVAAERAAQAAQVRLTAEMEERQRIATELRLAQKLESVGRLAAGLAHEINTPMQYIGDSVQFVRGAFDDVAGVLNAARSACEPSDDSTRLSEQLRAQVAAADLDFVVSEVPAALERALDGVNRVSALVRAMREFAYPDASEQQPADVNRAIETTLAVCRNEYKYVASVECHFAELPLVSCNIGELNQVFLNLIVNAAHAIHETSKDAAHGKIEITTQRIAEAVQISIADNGCGIPPENLEKIFDPFFTTKEVGRGTGQGLAIARSIVVDRHRGRLDLESVVGSGTRFTIELPIAGRANPPRAH